MPPDKTCCGLLRRRQCLLPTWRGWLLFVLICSLLVVVAVRSVHPFLAVNDPKPGGALVVEGWASDAAMAAVVAEFKQNHYERLFGPLEEGAPLSDYKTYAELGAAVLLKLGLGTNQVQAVPAPRVRQDRTYAAAVALRDWLRAHGPAPKRFNLLTVGPHARRSRLLFEKALGKDAIVGVRALPEENYDPNHWWQSSQGFRVVTGEVIAYVYVRLLFGAP